MSRREARERGLLLLFLLGAAALLAWARWDSHREIEALERSRLAVQARAIEQNLTRQFAGLRAALRSTREDIDGWPQIDRLTRARARLQALRVATPGMLALSWLDAQGRVVAASRGAEGQPAQPSDEWFAAQAQRPQLALLYLSRPYAVAVGDAVSGAASAAASGAGPGRAMRVSVAMFDTAGHFNGTLSATLGSAYFDTLLGSVLYARDMWAAIVHASGDVLLIHPLPPGAPTSARVFNVARPGSLFSRHLASGAPDTLLAGEPVSGVGETRLAAQRTMRPAELGTDAALVVAATRDWDTMFGAWARLNPVVVVLYAAFAVAAWLALSAHQRRRGEAQQRGRREAADAERLALALAGGDLALWDADLANGTGAVNERWYAMLGYEAGEISSDHAGWEALLHPQDRERVLAAQQAHVAGQTPAYEAQYRLNHKNGSWVWVLDRGRVVERDASGRALRMVGTHMDMSERVEADEALRRSEESLATTLYSIGDGVIATDAQGRVTRMNAAAERLTGVVVAQAQRQPLTAVFRLVDALSREPAQDPVAQVLQHGEVVAAARDTVLQARDGATYPIAASAAPIRAGDGAIVGVVLVFSDESENARMLQALREREAQLALITDMLPGPVARLDAQRRYRFANAAYRAWFGVEPASLVGKTCSEALGGELADLVHDPIGRALQGAMQRFDVTVSARGGPREAIVTITPDRDDDGGVRGVFMVVIDITERKRAEQELRLLEAAVAGLNDMVLITEAQPLEEPGPRIVFVNAAFERFTGWRRAEVLGRSPRFLRHADTDAVEMQRVDVALARGEAVRCELVNQTRDGRPYWVDIALVPLLDASGRPSHIVSVHRDVSERRRAAAAVHEAQQELAATLAAVPDLLFDLDAEGRIHNYHSPRRDLLLMAPPQFVGRLANEVLPPDAGAVVMQALADAQEHGYSGGLQYELPLPHGAHWFELSVSSKAVAEGATPRFIALARDITERHKAESERQALESQLREAQKIESIGTLAGGIAHDFNNILAAILGNVALARGDLAPGHPAHISLEQIRRASLRARTLVQQILSFSRRQANPLRVQALQPQVEETLALLRATLPARIRVDTRLADTPLWLQADATQLQQVLMNLCTNAWHALAEEGGLIEIGCEAVPAGLPALAQEAELAALPTVHLWVRDNGSGMDAATRERIFDPFFTTKPVGQGTGLGLSVVHGIVRSHRGAVLVDSQPGVGSSFHLYFPAAPPPQPQAGGDEPAAQPGNGGRGQHVLYVDDDEVMLLMVQRLLEREGYAVTTSPEAAQALELLRAAPGRFDIVVSDYNMPELSGIDLARQMLALRPGLPLVISSGFVTKELRQRAGELGVRGLLHKERTLEELPALLQRLLS